MRRAARTWIAPSPVPRRSAADGGDLYRAHSTSTTATAHDERQHGRMNTPPRAISIRFSSCLPFAVRAAESRVRCSAPLLPFRHPGPSDTRPVKC